MRLGCVAAHLPASPLCVPAMQPNVDLDPAARVLEIEARQDEALRLLTELERKIEQVLQESLTLAARPISCVEELVEHRRAA
jgi:hypothetical protein